MKKQSTVLIVLPNGTHMGFEIPSSAGGFYVMGHKVFQPYASLFIDGVCQHNGGMSDEQVKNMEFMMAATA